MTLPIAGLPLSGRDGQDWLSTHMKVTPESLGIILSVLFAEIYREGLGPSVLISSPGPNANPAGRGCNTAISSNSSGVGCHGGEGCHEKAEVISIKTPPLLWMSHSPGSLLIQ